MASRSAVPTTTATFDASLPRQPRLVIKNSDIHGKGLFAGETIERGQYIGRYEGPVVQYEGDHVLWILDDDGTGYGIDGQNEMRWVNHSDNPNAQFYEEEMYALRTIHAGEEITYYYGDEWVEEDDDEDEYEYEYEDED